MSPGARKTKSRIGSMVTANIKEYHLSKEDKFEVLSLAMKKLGVHDQASFLRKATKAGRKMTDLATLQKVWKFWHDQAIPSTNTNQIFKLRVAEKLRI